MLRRLGIGRGVALRERGFEAILHEPVIRSVIVEPIAFRNEVVVRRHHVGFLRLCLLQPSEQARIDTELQNRAGARFGRELRVDDFV